MFDYAGVDPIQLGATFITELKDRKLLDEDWIERNEIKKPSPQGEVLHVGSTPPEQIGWEQDPDTLDTWFSSGLWTFSTLGWPDNTADLATYHPTNVLETGYDILFFWVARMILMSGYLLGDVPFRTVYLHGLVRDAQGRKMSKSLGNSIDPVDMVEKYGADATRLSLLMGAAPGNDLKLSEDRVRGYKHFANKLWNIARFVFENGGSAEGDMTSKDALLVVEAQKVAQEITRHIEGFRLDLAADAAYHYVWDRFAAVIIEESKPILYGGDAAAQTSRARALYEILTTSLKFLHPFMPFVTEEIWAHVPSRERELLMVERWPMSPDESTNA
jgi:valyl-tRNA synthetase